MNRETAVAVAAAALGALVPASAAPAWAAAGGKAAGSLEIDAQPREVVVGDPFRISVSASDVDAGSLQPPRFSNPDAAPLHSPNFSSRSSYFNGRRSSSTSWSWTVLPSGTGVVSFGEARLDIGGGRFLVGKVPDVLVIAPPPQPWVRVNVRAPRSVVPSEIFEVGVKISVKAAAGTPFSDNPLVPDETQDLTVPWIFGDGTGSAVTPALDVQQLAQNLQSASSGRRGGGGFAVNNQLRVRPEPHAQAGGDDGGESVEYSFSVPFRAVSEGVAEFAPVRFSGHVVAVGDGGAPVRSPYIVALSDIVRVRVAPPPAEGRPDGYSGIVGTGVEARTMLDAQTCRQGDPLELTLEIGGGAAPETVKAPPLFSDPAIAAIFRSTGEPVRRETDSGVSFKWRVRPIASGTLEVPPVAVSWFDLPTRSYKTTRTAPLPLRVDPVASFDPDALFADAASGGDGVEAASGGSISTASARRLSPPALVFEREKPVAPFPSWPASRWIAVLALPPALWLVAVLWAPIRRRAAPRFAAARRRVAAKRAEARLLSAVSARAAAAATADWLRAAGRRGDKNDSTEGSALGAGFGASELEDAMLRAGSTQDAAASAAAILREMEEAQFRPGADEEQAVRERRAALADIVRAALRSTPLAALLAMSALALAPNSSYAAVTDPALFRWRKALAAASAVSNADSALASAREFAAIASDEPSGAAFRNLGSLLLVAEKPGPAREAFLHAEALEGRTRESDCGLAMAAEHLPPPRNMLRAIAARHARVAPPRIRAIAFAGFWIALWLLLAARATLGPKSKGLRTALAVLAAPCALAALCAFLSLAASHGLLSTPITGVDADADADATAAQPATAHAAAQPEHSSPIASVQK